MAGKTERPEFPESLRTGAVRGWHIVVLWVMAFAAGAVMSHYMTLDVDSAYRYAAKMLVWDLVSAAFMVILTICVPELRRAVPALLGDGWDNKRWADSVIAIGVMFAWSLGVSRLLFLYLPVLFDESLYGSLQLEPTHEVDATYLLFAVINSVLVAPVAEELIFRGYLQNLWMHSHGTIRGVLYSSLFFGLAHFHAAPFATVMGLLFAFVYLKYRSLLPCIALHAFHNSVAFALGPSFAKSKESVALASSWMIEIALSIAFIPFVILFWRRFNPQIAARH